MTDQTEGLKPLIRDGEGFGGWNGWALPNWLIDWLAPYSAELRAHRLSEMLDALMIARPPSADRAELREQWARIIDPKGWDTFERQTKCAAELYADDPRNMAAAVKQSAMYIADSLAKADQIIATLPVEGEPVGWAVFNSRDNTWDGRFHDREQADRLVECMGPHTALRARALFTHPARPAPLPEDGKAG